MKRRFIVANPGQPGGDRAATLGSSVGLVFALAVAFSLVPLVSALDRARAAEQRLVGIIGDLQIGAVTRMAPTATPETSAVTPRNAARFIENLGGRAITLLNDPSLGRQQRAQALRELLLRGLDADAIGRVAIGDYWKAATPAQRAEYQFLFREFIVGVYTARLGRYGAKRMTVAGVRKRGKKFAIVETVVYRAGKSPVRIEWLVRPTASGHRVLDLVVRGLSMAIIQRFEFASIIKSSGGNVEALLAALRAKLT